MKFTYNSRIIKQLGTELITSDSIALTELIKNSYDAKAFKVNICFLDSLDLVEDSIILAPIPEIVRNELMIMNSNFIIVEDNGIGMDAERLQRGFFEIGSDIKEKQRLEDISGSIILGNKGIGRLSAQRLSPVLFVETAALNKKGVIEINFVKISWIDFENSSEADAKHWTMPSSKNETYTRLWMCGLPDKILIFDKFFKKVEEQNKDLFGNSYGPKREYYKIEEDILSKLNFLYSPFEQEQNPLDLKLYYNSQLIKAEFNKDNLTIAEAVHSFALLKGEKGLDLSLQLIIKPWFIQRIHQSEVGNILFQDYKKDATFYRELQLKYQDRYRLSLMEIIPIDIYAKKQIKKDNKHILLEQLENEVCKLIKHLTEISPVEGKIFSFKRDRKMLDMAYQSAINNNYIHHETKIDDIKSFLEAYNGVKLYRNGYRIAILGDKSSDWLKLQQKRTTGQQFYRFELGNAMGYVKINDPNQEFISETSSREDITDKPHKKALADLLDFVFNDCFYHLTRNAVEITKDILNDEGLIPKNKPEDIEKESNNAKGLLTTAENNLKAFTEVFNIIKENKDLDSEEKIQKVKSLIDSIDSMAKDLGGNLKNSFQALKSADKLLIIAKEEKKRIEIETYNNYKLMANGLVTEVITHELHSLIQDKNDNMYDSKIEVLKNYLYENNNILLYKDNLYPLKKRLDQVTYKMNDLKQFYNFLEKTFVYSGKSDDFESQNLKDFLLAFTERNRSRLDKYKIFPNYDNADGNFNVPKGAFMHVFYNLFDNSIYWIGVRQKRANHDKLYSRNEDDSITINIKDKNTIQYFDSGIGVLEKYQYTLFQPMVSGKENGRGMGMYIVKKFLESFDAKIELLDEPNKYGNRYIFEITFNAEFEN